jgi:hypothetical protein
MLVNYDVDSLKAPDASSGNNWPVRALEWIGLLAALGVCAWVILNYG